MIPVPYWKWGPIASDRTMLSVICCPYDLVYLWSFLGDRSVPIYLRLFPLLFCLSSGALVWTGILGIINGAIALPVTFTAVALCLKDRCLALMWSSAQEFSIHRNMKWCRVLKSGTVIQMTWVRCKTFCVSNTDQLELKMATQWENKSCTTGNKNKIYGNFCVFCFTCAFCCFQRKGWYCLAYDELPLQWLAGVYYLL